MNITLNKNAIIKNLNTELSYKYENSTHNNGNNEIMGLLASRYVVSEWVKENIDLTVSATENVFGYHLNQGDLLEIAYNHYKRNYISHKHFKGENDSENPFYTEIKCLFNIHSTAKIESKNLNGGYIIGLPDGLYYLTAKKISENLKDFPVFKRDYLRVYANAVRKIGTLKIAFPQF